MPHAGRRKQYAGIGKQYTETTIEAVNDTVFLSGGKRFLKKQKKFTENNSKPASAVWKKNITQRNIPQGHEYTRYGFFFDGKTVLIR